MVLGENWYSARIGRIQLPLLLYYYKSDDDNVNDYSNDHFTDDYEEEEEEDLFVLGFCPINMQFFSYSIATVHQSMFQGLFFNQYLMSPLS